MFWGGEMRKKRLILVHGFGHNFGGFYHEIIEYLTFHYIGSHC